MNHNTKYIVFLICFIIIYCLGCSFNKIRNEHNIYGEVQGRKKLKIGLFKDVIVLKNSRQVKFNELLKRSAIDVVRETVIKELRLAGYIIEEGIFVVSGEIHNLCWGAKPYTEITFRVLHQPTMRYIYENRICSKIEAKNIYDVNVLMRSLRGTIFLFITDPKFISALDNPHSLLDKTALKIVKEKKTKIKIEKRLALTIGNSKYKFGGMLKNPVNDARAIKNYLEDLDFKVFIYENSNQRIMKKAIGTFGSNLSSYDVGLFFFAGHGVQVKGINYLIPVDAILKNENDVEYDCIRADRVLAKMENAGSQTNIVILDACRDNPFERSWQRGLKGKGLAFMNAPSGSFIAYATSPGNTASDGIGMNNGLYTTAILEHIKTPNITIEQMFKRVRVSLMDRSLNKQVPWEATSLRGDFYFNIE